MKTLRANDLQQALTLVVDHIALSDSPRHVTPDVLAMIAEAFHCQWSTYWRVDSQALHLYPKIIWNQGIVSASRLDRDTDGRALSLSEGTAGHVWRTRKPVWTRNLVLDMCLPRSLDAVEAGLHGGIWFALKTNSAVYGVIEILGTDVPPPSEEALVVVEQFGVSLGLLLESDWSSLSV